MEHYLTGSTFPFPLNDYPTIEALAEAALRKCSSRRLSWRSRLGAGALIRPVETTYHDELYRALNAVLGFSLKVSSEWTGNGSESGRIDFRIDDVNWGIELLREGNNLAEHCQRFVADGDYTQWIQSGWLRDWLIIDCRTSPPRAPPYSKVAPRMMLL